jgi:hypothetical protein
MFYFIATGWTWKAELKLIASALLIVLAICAPLWWLLYRPEQAAEARHAAERAHAAFQPGDIVRSRVTNFRGMVTGVSCAVGCEFRVRFYAATMVPVWVEEYEIEPAK